MGMLMHYTLLEQQKKAKAKAKAEKPVEEEIPFTEPEEKPEDVIPEQKTKAQARKTTKPAARRKTSK